MAMTSISTSEHHLLAIGFTVCICVFPKAATRKSYKLKCDLKNTHLFSYGSGSQKHEM